MFLFKKKKKEETPTEVEAPQPKEVKWTAIMKLKYINIHTDKEYCFSSTNKYGLSWDYAYKSEDKWMCILRQKNNADGTLWSAIAHLHDFSLIEIVREEKSEMVIPENTEEDNA